MNEEMKNQTEQLPLLKVHMMGRFFPGVRRPADFLPENNGNKIDETSADFPL
mgnify:FL=1